MKAVVASAADARYGKWLVNLVGSIQRRSDSFDEIVVYDLGLTPFQRSLLANAKGVDVRTVPPFVPHWRAGRTWKTWIWTHVDADVVVWLDAGVTVLRPMVDVLEHIRQHGYFVVSTEVPCGPSTPSDYDGLYDLPARFADRVAVTAGVLGFDRRSTFYSKVIEPTYEDAVLGRNLGFSESEVTKLNWGLDELEQVIVRDCPIFRHEQTLLNIHLYASVDDPKVQDLGKYAGHRSPRDHPEQVIWNHRRRGDYRFLPRVRYDRRAAVGLVWGSAVYIRERARHYRWLLRPGLYVRIARRLLATRGLRAGSAERP